MKLTLPRSTFGLALLLALGTMSMEHARAGKPPSPPPSAPGKILFAYAANGGTIYEMNGNGTIWGDSGLSFGSISYPVPSSIAHGGSRWWLTHIDPIAGGNTDMGITNDGKKTIQLTKSGFIVNPDGTETHVIFSPHGAKPSWSNNGLDSFCSVQAFRYVYHPDTSITDQETVIYRMDIDADDWGLISNGGFTPFFPGDPRITAVISTTFPTGTLSLQEHHWSPDGNWITFTNANWKVLAATDLFVADVTSGVEVNVDDFIPIVPHQVNTSGVKGPRWCPTPGDNRILYCSNGQICTISSGNTVVNLASGVWTSFWSPDGVYVAYDKWTTKGVNYTYNVWRVPASGGTSVNLTSNLDPAIAKQLKGWTR